MNNVRLISPSDLSARTYSFPERSTGRVTEKREYRDDVHRDEWALASRSRVSTFHALAEMQRLERAGWRRA